MKFNGEYRGTRPARSAVPVCPYCGKNEGYWGGMEQHGVQVDGGRNVSWATLDRDPTFRRRYGLGWNEHQPVGFRCRAWETYTCTSKMCRNRKVWVDEQLDGGLGAAGPAYAEARRMNPRFYIPVPADELGRAILPARKERA